MREKAGPAIQTSPLPDHPHCRAERRIRPGVDHNKPVR
jgi:hypothetical protein